MERCFLGGIDEWGVFTALRRSSIPLSVRLEARLVP